ncbi:DNA cytosine methyltransferase [Labrys portucalensis]|uniref:DNA (cytosine-5-)-methyltransferase n=1 Tax=Labrys neptuniae TaxID=376174 RepID=A0ABV6Z8P5_9HYPH
MLVDLLSGLGTAAPMEFEADELIVDLFAGGGGASLGIEMALGRSPDIAVNHDADAIRMHAVNHPRTLHLQRNVWQVDPLDHVGHRRVGLLWASPDCKHHSKAKGGKPLKRNIRDLAWVVVHWAKRARPRVIMLENVEEFRDWGPLTAEGRPCPDRKGQTFARWTSELRRLGYKVEHRELSAKDYGIESFPAAPTLRKRLFLIARRDGRKIVWPKQTHGDPESLPVKAGKLKPWRTAAEIIDWWRPCPSIFLTREEGRAIGCNRPLADNTMARIAKGVQRYVIDAAKPFIVPVTHAGDARVNSVDEPLRTITCAPRGEHALVSAVITGCGGRMGQSPPKPMTAPMNTVTAKADQVVAAVHLSRQFGASVGSDADAPVGTITAGGGGKTAVVAAHVTKFRNNSIGSSAEDPLPTVTANSFVKRPGGAAPIGVVAAFLNQHNSGMVGHEAREPVSTIVGKGCTQAVTAAHLMSLHGSDRRGQAVDAPAPTICAGGGHLADVRAFLIKYYGAGIGQELSEPTHTVPTHDRFGLVMVEGEPFQIVDIGMRMLTPRELFRAQGFPDSYQIEKDADGRPFTSTVAVRCCGNSVCPPVAAALVAANCADLRIALEAAE